MVAMLLVGGPGSGKSTVTEVLQDRGLDSVDLDWGYARWEDGAGCEVGLADVPDREWLAAHRWVWRADRLEPLLERAQTTNVLLSGTSNTMHEWLPRFDVLVLLQIDDATTSRRLADPARDNDDGRVGDTAAVSREWRPVLEAEMLVAGAIPVDATLSPPEVADAVVRACAGAGYPIARL